MLTDAAGEVTIAVPRDRAGTFEPVIVKERQGRSGLAYQAPKEILDGYRDGQQQPEKPTIESVNPEQLRERSQPLPPDRAPPTLHPHL